MNQTSSINFRRILWISIGLILLILISFQFFKDYDIAPFTKHLESYLEKPKNLLLAEDSAPPDSVVITGKLVVVNLNQKIIDPMFTSLPPDLKPENPEEVKTVLWLDCRQSTSLDWTYTDGSRAAEIICRLTFIDFVNKKYLWTKEMIIAPPQTKTKHEINPASDPSANILQYLQNIPHKN